MGVTSGPLLPDLWGGGVEYRYECVACGLAGRGISLCVPFPAGDTPPATLRLPCVNAPLDPSGFIARVPLHLYRLVGPATPADQQ